MANRKKRCKHCRAYHDANSMIHNNLGWYCCKDHMIEDAVSNKKPLIDKGRKIQHKERKESLKTRAKWLSEAQAVFNRYIRLRDKMQPCISCCKPLKDDVRLKGHLYDAGHYRSVGACPELRFNEDNVHAQCVKCNRELSGNAADYRINLVKRIGRDRVDALEGLAPPRKYTIEYLKVLIGEYKMKCKDLK